MSYYSLINQLFKVVDDYVMPIIRTFFSESILKIIDKVIRIIHRITSNFTKDRFGYQISIITKLFIRHMAKEKLIPLMHDPIGSMSENWEDDEDMFGDDSIMKMLTESLTDVTGIVKFIMSIVNDSPPEPIIIKVDEHKPPHVVEEVTSNDRYGNVPF